MKIFPRLGLGSRRSIFSPKKAKDDGTGKEAAAPSVPAVGKDIPTPSVPGVGSDIPTLSVPGIGTDLPTPSVAQVDKNLPTPSAAGPAKGTPAPSVAGADSATDIPVNPSTVTTSITVSVTDTRTVTRADATVTIVQHDLATVATTAPTTIPVVQHDLATEATTVPTTIVTTIPITPSTAHPTTALLPLVSTIPVAAKHTEPAVIVSVVFGLISLGLLAIVLFLVVKLCNVAKAKEKATVGMKTYAEEFDWPLPRPIELNDIEWKSKRGSTQKEAGGIA